MRKQRTIEHREKLRVSAIERWKNRGFDHKKVRNCDHCHEEFTISNGRQRWCMPCMGPDMISRGKLKNYDLSHSEFLALLETQNNKCRLCDVILVHGGSLYKSGLTVDHDHDTGIARGLLCQACNRALGFVERPDWLKKAFEYLDEDRSTARKRNGRRSHIQYQQLREAAKTKKQQIVGLR